MMGKRIIACLRDRQGFSLLEAVVSLAIMSVVLTLFAGILIQGNTFLAKTKHLDQSLNEVVGKFEGVPAMDEVKVQPVGEWVNLQLTLGIDLKGNPVMVEPQVQVITEIGRASCRERVYVLL